jgi:hypothetical protein
MIFLYRRLIGSWRQKAGKVAPLLRSRGIRCPRGSPVPLTVAVALKNLLGALLAITRPRSWRRPQFPPTARPQSQSSRAARPHWRSRPGGPLRPVVWLARWISDQVRSRKPDLVQRSTHERPAKPPARYRAIGHACVRLRYRPATPNAGTRREFFGGVPYGRGFEGNVHIWRDDSGRSRRRATVERRSPSSEDKASDHAPLGCSFALALPVRKASGDHSKSLQNSLHQ